MTKQERAALNDVKRLVRSLLRNAEKDALQRIERMAEDGVDIAADHIKNGGNYVTAKNLVCAVALELASKRGHGPRWRTDEKTVKNYLYHF